MNSDAQKRAQARYDKKRPKSVSIRLTAAQLMRLDMDCRPGEARSAALMRGWESYINRVA